MFNDTLSASAKLWLVLCKYMEEANKKSESDSVCIFFVKDFDGSVAQVHAVA